MPGTVPPTVGINECKRLRKAAREGASARAGVEELGLDIHPGTARTHASGDCGCETDENPHPFRSWERQVTPEDCSRLRTLVSDGLSVPDAVEELGLSGTTGAAGYHVRGDCRCESDVPPRPVGATEMDPDDCTALRRLADRGVSSTAAVAELGLNVAPGTAREHARGNCPCDTDVSPVPFDSTRSVTPGACGELRRLADRGVSASAAIDTVGLDVHPDTARDHARGDCTCDTSVPPTSFAGTGGGITAGECGELRRFAEDGLSPSAAIEAIGLDIQPRTARNHATDNCTCNTDVPPQSFQSQEGKVTAEECGELRRFASGGRSASDAVDAIGVDITPGTGRMHARGDCNCETDVPETPFDYTRTVTDSDCGELRRLAAAGVSATDAIEELGIDVSPQTARYHAKDRCTCDTDVSAHSFSGRRGSVTVSDCAALRRMAREGLSAQAALDSLGLEVTTTAAGRHANGDCTCDTDVPRHPFGHDDGLDPDECEAIRRLAADGRTARAAVEELEFDIGKRSVWQHARGDCSCDSDVGPHPFGAVRNPDPEDCAGLRRRAADGMTADDAIEDLGLDLTRSAACRHARGDCTCDTDVPAHPFQSRGRSGVSPKECADIRRQLASGVDVTAVETTYSGRTVRKHGTGKCDHEIDEPAVCTNFEEVTFTSEMCELAERLYYEEHYHTGQIKAEIDDRFQEDVEEGTIKYHLVDDCDHPP